MFRITTNCSNLKHKKLVFWHFRIQNNITDLLYVDLNLSTLLNVFSKHCRIHKIKSNSIQQLQTCAPETHDKKNSVLNASLHCSCVTSGTSRMMESKAAMMVTILLCCSSISPAFAQKHKGPPAAAAVSLPPSPAPSPAAPRHVDLADLLSVAGPFHTFLDLLEKTDVLRTFQSQANGSKDGITVFVPKDAAFASLARSATANLTSDQLKSLALYHALPRYYSLAEFNRLGGAASPVPTLAGGEYTVNVTDDMGTVHVGSMWSNPKISSSVYSTRPVAVYEVDRVLLPMQIFRTDPPMSPSPAPAPDAKPASDAASPLPGKSSSAKAKADEKKSSSSPPSSRRGAGIAGYFLALAASASAGLLLLC